MTYLRIALAIALASVAQATLAAPSEIRGLVTYVDQSRQTVTVRNETNGARRTYFVNESSRLANAAGPITLGDLKRGQVVRVRYTPTDRGRVLDSATLTDATREISTARSEPRTVAGTISGVRSAQRTLTIRDADTRQRLTLKVAEDARIRRDGRDVRLGRLTRGEYITARYRETPQGLVLVTENRVAVVETPQVRAAEPAPAPVAAVLPKTGSQDFAWLFLALTLATVGLGVRLNRA